MTGTLFLTTKGMKEIFEALKVEPVDEKHRRYKSDWLRQVRMNNNRTQNITEL